LPYDPVPGKQVNKAFAAQWKAAIAECARFQTSDGGNAARARTVIDRPRAEVI
jgi:ABC-type sulfate transport system substrate-binding protein